jgi:prophage antirepressor-like protein
MAIVRNYENAELNLSMDAFIDKEQNIYFKGKEAALALGYEKPADAIRKLVPEKHRIKQGDLKGSPNWRPHNMQPHQVLITEPGLYCLIFSSKLPTAERFRDWVFEDVLPSIRKCGQYDNRLPNQLTYRMENEYDLHTKVVNYVKKLYPQIILIAGLGELQDTKRKRINSWRKGYQKGQPDIIINNYHITYNRFCIEFKTPKGNGVVSPHQAELFKRYEENNYKVLVSNDYDVITREIMEYCAGVRILCRCKRGFKTMETLQRHCVGFHRINPCRELVEEP